MKQMLVYICMLLYITAFSQEKETAQTVEISKTRLMQATHIYELIPSLPRHIYNFSATMMSNTYGKIRSSASNGCGKIVPGQENGDVLDEEQLRFLKTTDVGSTIYISIKYTEQKDQPVKTKTAALHISDL